MIFHITGPSGSGKTTLGEKLKKLPNVFVIDTDEIDDTNALEILSDSKYKHFFSSDNAIGGFWKMLEQKNNEKLFELLENNNSKHIIIIGMTIYPPKETGVIGYSINIKPDDLYYQLNKRTLKSINSNSNELENLLKNEKNKYIVDLTTLFKYKIRQSFPILPHEINNGIEIRKKHDTELGYKYIDSNEIFSDIEQIISKPQRKLSRKK